MTPEDRMHADELDRYWDTLAPAQPRPGTEPLGGETADMIDRLWRLGAPPNADAARERVWRRLQRHRAWEERNMDAVAPVENASKASYGRTSPIVSGASRPLHGGGQAGWQSVMGQMATAALLVLVLAGSIVTFGPGRPGQESPAPARIMAVSAPLATPETDEVATTTLLDLVIPTFGDDTAWVQLDRYTFPAATMLEVDMRGGRVPEVFFVVDGALEVRALAAPQPIRVIRSGGADTEESLVGGESAKLNAGDAVLVPEDGAANLMNMATEPANALLVLIPSGVKFPQSTGIRIVSPVGSIRNLSAPLTLALEQVTLDPGASLPGVNALNVERVVVPIDPDRVMDARIGSNGSLRNAGGEPLEAYVLSVTSGAPLP